MLLGKYVYHVPCYSTWIKNLNSASCLSSFSNFSIWRYPNDFLSWLVTMDETWLYHYDLETKQQSMGWRHSVSPHPSPKKFWVQKSAEKFLPQFFWLKMVSSSLIILQRAKLSVRSITHLCWCNWRKNATPWECHQVGLVLAWQCPGSPGKATQKKQAYLGLQCLDHPSYFPDLAPSDYTCSLAWVYG
jgi:hypothetical protein